MKYFIVWVSNGSIQSDKIIVKNTFSEAKVAYWGKCQALENEPSVIRGEVAILDEELNKVQGYSELITHEQAE